MHFSLIFFFQSSENTFLNLVFNSIQNKETKYLSVNPFSSEHSLRFYSKILFFYNPDRLFWAGKSRNIDTASGRHELGESSYNPEVLEKGNTLGRTCI